jgi:hypothetical protein
MENLRNHKTALFFFENSTGCMPIRSFAVFIFARIVQTENGFHD